MTTMLPRVSITFNDDPETKVQGKVNSLALGFGIHQAWMYAAMFCLSSNTVSTASLMPAPSPEPSLVFLVSIITLACAFLFAAVTDQKFLEFYTAKRVIIGASVLVSVGTLAIPFASPSTAIGTATCLLSGILTGAGSALLLLFWGTNFSRHGSITIILNTAIAIVLSFAIFSAILHLFSYMAACVVAALLPLCELPFLWNLTPVSYAVRHAVPIFDPLPVRKLPFSIRIALPTFLFGLIVGTLRFAATSTMFLSTDTMAQLLVLFIGGAVTTILLVVPFCINAQAHWDGLFRPVIIFIAGTLLVLPLTPLGTFDSNSFIIVIGCMCFEALMWVFLSELAQEFRLSPVFMFGIGQGFLALGSAISPFATAIIFSLEPLNAVGETAVALFIVVVAYATMPHVSDIKRAITIPESTRNPAIAVFNQRAEATAKAAISNGRDSSQANAEPKSASLGGESNSAESQGEDAQNAHADSAPKGANANLAKTSEIQARGNDAKPAGSDRKATAAVREEADNAAPSPVEYAPGLELCGQLPEIVAPPHSSARSTASAPSPSASASEADVAKKSGRFRMQCETIANTYLLSRRETEVMFLLAKGYNAAYIQDRLYISKSTAKTHIGHIYRKLNIHNQQDLLRMVEEAYRG